MRPNKAPPPTPMPHAPAPDAAPNAQPMPKPKPQPVHGVHAGLAAYPYVTGGPYQTSLPMYGVYA